MTVTIRKSAAVGKSTLLSQNVLAALDLPIGTRVAVAAGDTIYHGMTGRVVACDNPAPAVELRKVAFDGQEARTGGKRPWSAEGATGIAPRARTGTKEYFIWFGVSELVPA
jgi:hypothetical protein